MDQKADAADFNRIVDIYERTGAAMSRPFAKDALDRAGVAAGERVIDVATGTGVLAVAAAERGAQVLATDIAPAMVARAAEHLRRFEGCEARIMSLDALDVPDGVFDAAFSVFGVLAFSTWRKGLDELLRVTRPGGRVAVTMWREGWDTTPAYVMKRVFEECFPGRELWPQDFFPRWSVVDLEVALRRAGCTEAEAYVCEGEWHPVGVGGEPLLPAQALDEGDLMFRNFPGYANLSAGERERLRKPLTEAFAVLDGPDRPIRLPTQAYVAVGRKDAGTPMPPVRTAGCA